MITIHLVHIGARVYISQFEGTHFLNIVVKFRSDINNHPIQNQAILNAISPMSMCKAGCHPKEVVDLKKVLTDAGVDVDGQKEDDDEEENVAEEIVNIDEDTLEQERRISQMDHYPEYEEDEASARKPPKRRYRRENSNQNKPKQRKNRNKNNRKNKKNRKQQNNQKSAGVEDAFHMLRSSSSAQPQYFDPSELVRSGEKSQALLEAAEELIPEPQSKTPHETCEDMREYYRLTCLYDVAVKGISNIDPHRFAASFDERRLDGDFSYIFDKAYYSTSSTTTLIPVMSFTVFVVVLFAIFHL